MAKDQNEYIVLVRDTEGEWTITVQTTNRKEAMREHKALKSQDTPTLLICPQDYVTI